VRDDKGDNLWAVDKGSDMVLNWRMQKLTLHPTGQSTTR
jgi:hypothetical protein